MSDLMIVALRSQIVDLQLARKHSSQMIEKLMGEKLSDEQRAELFQLVLDHCMANDDSRSAQLSAVIRTSLLTLNSMAQRTADQKVKQDLIEVIKALNISVGFEESSRVTLDKAQVGVSR